MLKEEIEAWLDLLITEEGLELASPKVAKKRVALGINEIYRTRLLKAIPKERKTGQKYVTAYMDIFNKGFNQAIKEVRTKNKKAFMALDFALPRDYSVLVFKSKKRLKKAIKEAMR